MKALIIAMFLFSAVSISAENPAPDPYCQCQGKGIPVSPPTLQKQPEIPARAVRTNERVQGHLERLFYEWQWYWMVYEHFYLK